MRKKYRTSTKKALCRTKLVEEFFFPNATSELNKLHIKTVSAISLIGFNDKPLKLFVE